MMKKIISMVAALSMMLSAAAFTTVASATETPSLKAELVNVSDDTFAVGTTFEVKVSYAGIPVSENEDDWAGTGFTACGFTLELPGYGTTYTKNGKTWAVDTLGADSTNAATKNLSGTDYIYGWAGPVTADTAYRVGEGAVLTLKFKTTAEITEDIVFALKDITLETITYDASEAKVGADTYTTNPTGDQKAMTASNATIEAAKEDPQPTVETVNADTVALAAPGENEVAGTDVAAAYKATYTFVTGQTAAWTATGKVDLPINMANISGETTLGLIVKDAAVSGVALKVTTPAN